MKRIIHIPLLLCMTTAMAEPLKDPRTRDEDISQTRLDVEVTKLPSGFYNYIYTLAASEENKALISSFNIDLSCDKAAETVGFPEPPTVYPWDYASADRHHAPMQPYPSPTGAAWMILSRDNRLSFLMTTEPGETHTGYRVLSPYPPMDRPFEIRINWTTSDYDYSGLTDEEWDELAVRDDFWVSGMTKGPGCSPLPEPPALFPGTGNEPDDVLLQYAAPMRSAFHAESGTVVFDIHYAGNINADTFKVQPGWAKRYFTPVAGTHQVVEVKLHPGVNRFQFRVEREVREDTSREPAVKRTDGDYFMIRRDPPGHSRRNGREGKQ